MLTEVHIFTDEQRQHLLLYNAVSREIILTFPDDNNLADIGSANIISDSFELVQSICDESEFKLGGGVAGQMRIELFDINATALQGKKVQIKIHECYSSGALVPSDELKPTDDLSPGLRENTIEAVMFTGTVYEVKRKKSNRSVFELVAYDKLYECAKIRFSGYTLSDIYTRGYPSDFTNLYGFLERVIDAQAYMDNFSIENEQTATFNQLTSMQYLTSELISKVASNGFSFLEIMKACAELNAGFLICDRFGRFKTISLCQFNNGGTETEKIPPSENIQAYSNIEFEEYTVKPIHYISFPYNDIKHYAFGSDKNNSCYLSDNIITRMMTNNRDFVFGFKRTPNGKNFIFNDLYTYRPFKADVLARWWLEPGDRVTIQTGFSDMPTVDSFIFSRTIKGINGMKVTLEAKGNQYLGHKEDEDGSIQ